jgi:hypothetical protein
VFIFCRLKQCAGRYVSCPDPCSVLFSSLCDGRDVKGCDNKDDGGRDDRTRCVAWSVLLIVDCGR